MLPSGHCAVGHDIPLGTVLPSGHCTGGHDIPLGTVLPSGHCTGGHDIPLGTVLPSGHCTGGHDIPLGTVLPSGHCTGGHDIPLGTVLPSGHWIVWEGGPTSPLSESSCGLPPPPQPTKNSANVTEIAKHGLCLVAVSDIVFSLVHRKRTVPSLCPEV